MCPMSMAGGARCSEMISSWCEWIDPYGSVFSDGPKFFFPREKSEAGCEWLEILLFSGLPGYRPF